jgi:hypothetical protein
MKHTVKNFGLSADPDPAFNLNADPDPAFNLNADPDPAFYLNADPDLDPGSREPNPMRIRIRILVRL